MSIHDDPFGECCDEDTLSIFCGIEGGLEADSAEATNRWLDEMEATQGWFSAPDER